VGINDAKVIHIERYRHLREAFPDRFVCTDEGYWEGVY
jgi:hypothetical protein